MRWDKDYYFVAMSKSSRRSSMNSRLIVILLAVIASALVGVGVPFAMALGTEPTKNLPAPSDNHALAPTCANPCPGWDYFVYYNSTTGEIVAVEGCLPNIPHQPCPGGIEPSGISVIN